MAAAKTTSVNKDGWVQNKDGQATVAEVPPAATPTNMNRGQAGVNNGGQEGWTLSGGALSPYSGSGSSRGKKQGMDWLTMDRLPNMLQKDSRTLWRTPDTRGVSQAHYYKCPPPPHIVIPNLLDLLQNLLSLGHQCLRSGLWAGTMLPQAQWAGNIYFWIFEGVARSC